MIEPQSFWKWAFSDFKSNALRGVLAEYIVATALGCLDRLRIEWDAYDLITPEGINIEVKSSGYLQSWKQTKLSKIRFDIGRKKSWYAETNTSSIELARSADVYVFCVFSCQDILIANPLDLSQWFFLVCPSKFLNDKFNRQKSTSLETLEKYGLKRILFSEVCDSIHRAKADVEIWT